MTVLNKILATGLLALTLVTAPVRAAEATEKYSLIDAGRVAYVEFSKALEQRNDRSTELGIYLSSIENYQLTLQQTADFYVIFIEPVIRPSMTIYGGGREYRISKKDLRVVDSVGYK